MKINPFFWKKTNNTKSLAEKQIKKNENIKKALAFELCMDDIDPITNGPDAGKYVIFNGEMYAQAILIAIRDKYNPSQKGWGKHYKISTISKIIRTARIAGASVLLGHNEITISYDKETVMLNNAHKKTAQVDAQTRQGIATTSNSLYNTFAKRDVVSHTAVTFDDDDHYSWFALPCVVLSPDKAKVDKVMSKIKIDLNIGSIRYTLPRYGQLSAIQAAIPFSNQIDARYLQKVNKRTIAAMSLLRNEFAEKPKEGPIICVDEETGIPIKICPSKKNPENTLIMAPPGSGKTTMICNLAAHAIANGDEVKIIEPKNEDADGSDYLNFTKIYEGEISRWGAGEDDVNPNPLIIYYNKERMGTRPASYRKAKNDHFEIVKSEFSAWVGGLNPRQSGIITYFLAQLYKERRILDDDGEPINTEKWDQPGALDWPSVHEFRLYARKIYHQEKLANGDKNEFYHDPSLDAFLMKTMDAEPGCPLWWWAKSKQHMDIRKKLQIFDISQVPDSIKSAIAIQIMGACNTLYFPKPNDGSKRVRTYLIFDELRNLIRTSELIPHIERSEREGRAPGITGVYVTQDPIIDETFLKTLKANCKNLFLLCNLNNTNIDIFMDAFNLDEKYRSRLMQSGNGIGIYFRDRIGMNIRIELDKMVEDALFNSNRGHINENAKCATTHGFEVEECYRPIYEEKGFFTPSWLINAEQDSYPGFKYYNPYDPLGRGTYAAYVREDLIKERDGLTKDGKEKQDLIGPEGEIHYCVECRIGGWLKRQNKSIPNIEIFPNVELNAYGLPDVTWGEKDQNGNLIDPDNSGCIEIEGEGTHKDVADWNGKLERARALGYKKIIFTGKSTVCAEMKGKKGSMVSEFVFPQGEKNLLKELERIRDEIAECKMRNLSINDALIHENKVLETPM